MADQTSVVKAVIEVLKDGAKGFPDIGEHLKDTSKKAYFMKEGATRAEYARELEAASGISSDGGTSAGAVHRVWGDLKASLGGGDHTLLDTAEQGEDAAKKAYKEALEEPSLTEPVRSLLVRQQTHIVASHDQVRAYRNATN